MATKKKEEKANAEAQLSQLTQGDIPPVVVLTGEERFLVGDALKQIRQHVLKGGAVDFNYDRLSARNKTMSDVLSMARTLPVFAPRRLVEVHESSSWSENDLNKLAAYLDAPSNQTVLVFIFDKLDQRQKTGKLLKDKKTWIAEFSHPNDAEMRGWVARGAKKLQLRLHEDAGHALSVTVGNNLGLLERALEKLSIATEPKQEITVADVSLHVASAPLDDVFSLCNAIVRGDRGEALAKLGLLEAGRETEPLALLGLLAWQLRQVLKASAMLDDNCNPQEIGDALKSYGDKRNALMSAAKRLSTEGHAKRLLLLGDIDRRIKSTRVSPWLMLVELIYELCPASRR